MLLDRGHEQQRLSTQGGPGPSGARDDVLALHRAYRAQATRFAQEEAELARRAARSLEAARQAVVRVQ